MVVAGIEVELVQKDIKNIHLAVYPPDGRVRLAAPKEINKKTLELYVTSKLPWIKKQQRKFASVIRQSPRQYLNRESHFYLGKRYLLRVHDSKTSNVECRTRTYLELYVKEEYSSKQKSEVLYKWYRAQLKKILEELVTKWESKLEIKANQVKIIAMKTKWGACKTENGNLIFNLELVKKPIECIEYVVVHELLHLIERRHNDLFIALLDKNLPNWRSYKEKLNTNN